MTIVERFKQNESIIIWTVHQKSGLCGEMAIIYGHYVAISGGLVQVYHFAYLPIDLCR